MEFGIAILVCALAGVPIGLIFLIRTVIRLRTRTAELEEKVNNLAYDLARLKQSGPAPAVRSTPQTNLIELIREKRAEKPATVEQSVKPVTPPPISLPALNPNLNPTPPPPPPLIVSTPADTAPTFPASPAINWEQFLGAKLFAWIGGLALFMGVAFFVKYSFEHNLIPPWLRVLAGFIVGGGLLVGGIFTRKRDYATLAQTLTATGIVILYAVSFTARSVYDLINAPTLFVLMLSITGIAFTLALRMDAKVIAVLGILGGFLTPFLVGGKSEQPFALFGYMLFLNAGLLAIAHYRQWKFLISLGTIATAITATIWAFASLATHNATATLVMTILLCAEYIASFYWTPDSEDEPPHCHFGGLVQGVSAFLLAIQLLGPDYPNLLVAAAIFAGNITVLALLWRGQMKLVFPVALGGSTLALAAWIFKSGDQANAYLLLGSVALSCLLNGIFPLWVARKCGETNAWPSAAGIAALLLMLAALVQTHAGHWFFWPAVLLVDLVLLGMALLHRNILLVCAGTILTVLLTAIWVITLEPGHDSFGPLIVMCGFAIVFYLAGMWLVKNLGAGAESQPAEKYFPVLPAVLPFFLMVLLIVRTHMTVPTAVFGSAGLMDLLLIGTAVWLAKPEVTLAALAGTLLVEYGWFAARLDSDNANLPLQGYIAFWLFFTAFPFITRRWNLQNIIAWRVSALAGPLHFHLIYQTARQLWPSLENPGLIPAVMALPSAAALFAARSEPEATLERKHRLTAAYGASALFFVTLIFPVQFSHEWLTIGWALEGAALIWLYRKAPVTWLIYAATALLTVAFVRLAVNPAVLEYHQRSGAPIFNWYLYTYGLVAAALFAATALISPEQMILKSKLRPIFATFGTILLFLLLNIEIADYFASGSYVTFEFSGNFARDMTYSIAWSIFALALLLFGVARLQKGVRYAGIGLMLVTVLKLFFHDLSQLDQRYRIGAFIGVAVILMLASFIYQRFLSQPKAAPKS